MTNGVLAILGSGETAPGMTKVHRELFKRYGDELSAVNIDTAYGFQENVPEMTEKLVTYFDKSLHAKFKPLHFPSFENADEIDRRILKQEIRESNFVFAGPGSPSYAVAQWIPLDLKVDLKWVLNNGGTLCFSSAAAATLGQFSPPIYEIYKAGSHLYWNEGLDLLSAYGLNCVVIPHFDNNEGSNYDTSCCYLGLRRLLLMESMLPENVATLGVDEHTAIIFDFEADTLSVLGRAHGYWRCKGTVRTLENKSVIPLEELRTSKSAVHATSQSIEASTLSDVRDLAELVLQGGDEGLEALATLVRRSSGERSALIDTSTLVDGVLAVRDNARREGQWSLADQLREALVIAGIEIHDGPGGSAWSLRPNGKSPTDSAN